MKIRGSMFSLLRTLRAPALTAIPVLAALAGASCDGEPDPLPPTQTFRVKIVAVNGAEPPSDSEPLPANTGTTNEVWDVEIEAIGNDGNPVAFDGLVNLRVQPGAVVSVENTDDGEQLGKNLRLSGGKATATVTVTAVYGPARLWVEDLGYQKAEDGETPACADGKNNDEEDDVLVDYPSDPGCAFADDNTETGGTFAAGTSPAVHYELPSVQNIQGTGSTTPYPFESITVNTEDPHELIVTRYSKDGFYVTDLSGQPPTCSDDSDCGAADSGIVCDVEAGNYCLPGCRGTGGNGCQVDGGECSSDNEDVGTCAAGPAPQPGVGQNHLFVFTFSTPGGLRPCDRMTYLSGTLSEFFGFTELNFPSYDVDPLFEGEEDKCKIPEPLVLSAARIGNPAAMEGLESALVRVKGYHVSAFLGPKPALNNVFFPDQTNCDLNGDGKVDFENEAESACGNACSDDPECSEWTSYLSRGNYKVAKQEDAGSSVIQINTDGAAEFNPVANRGLELVSVTGTLRNFSGGDLNWTIESRCADDVVCDAKGCAEEIMGPKKACVSLRTDEDNEQGTN
ncbi:MAG: hypothetical protein HOW73_25270 [Polyangiaceae bacterium]|nr:hypothetical protein [Polyangiaceae bacterium]